MFHRALVCLSLSGITQKSRDGNEPEPSKNEPNQNPGFAKNRTEPESKKCANTLTEPNPVKNRAEPEPKCHGSYSVLSLNEIVDTFTHFTVNEVFWANQVQVPA